MIPFEKIGDRVSNELLDTDPAVSIDIAVGKKLKEGESINIDYAALREVLVATGAPEDNSHSSIVIQKPLGRFGRFFKPMGSYYSDDSRTEVRLNRKASKFQRVLQHELRHYGDITENPKTRLEDIRTRIGNVAHRTVSYTALPNLGLSATLLASRVPFVEHMSTRSLMSSDTYMSAIDTLAPMQLTNASTALGATVVSALFYWNSKREKTARAAEKLDLPQVVNISKEA